MSIAILAISGLALIVPSIADVPRGAWIFEGDVLNVDAPLQPWFADGLVFSGSFQADHYSPRRSIEPDGAVRFFNGIHQFEFTLDRFRFAEFQANQNADWQWMDVLPGNESSETVSYRLLLGVDAILGEPDGWQLRWLEIGLTRYELSSQPDQSDWPQWRNQWNWDHGWFRIRFLNEESGDEAHADGILTRWEPAGAPMPPEQELEMVYSLLAELGRERILLDQRSRELAARLEHERGLREGMKRAMDLIIEERESWMSERKRMEHVFQSDQKDWLRREAEWEVRIALHEEEQLKRDARETEMRAALNKLEMEKHSLENELMDLRQALERMRQVASVDDVATVSEPSASRIQLISDEQNWEFVENGTPAAPCLDSDITTEPRQERTIVRRRGPRGRF